MIHQHTKYDQADALCSPFLIPPLPPLCTAAWRESVWVCMRVCISDWVQWLLAVVAWVVVRVQPLISVGSDNHRNEYLLDCSLTGYGVSLSLSLSLSLSPFKEYTTALKRSLCILSWCCVLLSVCCVFVCIYAACPTNIRSDSSCPRECHIWQCLPARYQVWLCKYTI